MKRLDHRPLPRERLTWHPTVNLEACLGDSQCLDSCSHDVFDWDIDSSRPVVARPLNCMLGCRTCAGLCPAEAIRLPPIEKLRSQVRRLRREEDAAVLSESAHDRTTAWV